MALEPFATSRELTLGIELELQVVGTHDFNLTPGAADLLRVMAKKKLPGEVKPEIAASMIEISTGVCESYGDAVAQLQETRDVLVEARASLAWACAVAELIRFSNGTSSAFSMRHGFINCRRYMDIYPSNSQYLANMCTSAVPMRIWRCGCCILYLVTFRILSRYRRRHLLSRELIRVSIRRG